MDPPQSYVTNKYHIPSLSLLCLGGGQSSLLIWQLCLRVNQAPYSWRLLCAKGVVKVKWKYKRLMGLELFIQNHLILTEAFSPAGTGYMINLLLLFNGPNDTRSVAKVVFSCKQRCK